MYSREFGSVKSDGNLEEMREAMRREEARREACGCEKPAEELPARRCEEPKSLINLDFLRNIEIDDLILIAIGVLLLLDSDTSNDFIIILIAAMLFL